jgi:hypothetical protein
MLVTIAAFVLVLSGALDASPRQVDSSKKKQGTVFVRIPGPGTSISSPKIILGLNSEGVITDIKGRTVSDEQLRGIIADFKTDVQQQAGVLLVLEQKDNVSVATLSKALWKMESFTLDGCRLVITVSVSVPELKK